MKRIFHSGITLLIVLGTCMAHAQSDSKTVVVRKNETLMDVSYRVYGTHKRWNEIYQLNKLAIKDPNNLEAGTVLHLKVAKTDEAPAAKEAVKETAKETAKETVVTKDAPAAKEAAPEKVAEEKPAGVEKKELPATLPAKPGKPASATDVNKRSENHMQGADTQPLVRYSDMELPK